MKQRAFLLFAAILLFTLPLCCQQQPAETGDQCFRAAEPAKCELNAGVVSYRNAKYELAITQFRRSLEFDPKLVPAQLYLAAALANQCTPGVDTPSNKQVCEQAVTGFSAVLDNDGSNAGDRLTATKSMASLLFQMKKFEEAKNYNRQTIAIDPNDAEAYYSIGVIDWTQAYTPRMEVRNRVSLKPDEPLDRVSCEKLAPTLLPIVEDGMKMLAKAIELRPDYGDAMAYMNLMYRERADLDCGDKSAHDADILQADKWVDAALAAQKGKLERERTSAPLAAKP